MISPKSFLCINFGKICTIHPQWILQCQSIVRLPTGSRLSATQLGSNYFFFRLSSLWRVLRFSREFCFTLPKNRSFSHAHRSSLSSLRLLSLLCLQGHLRAREEESAFIQNPEGAQASLCGSPCTTMYRPTYLSSLTALQLIPTVLSHGLRNSCETFLFIFTFYWSDLGFSLLNSIWGEIAVIDRVCCFFCVFSGILLRFSFSPFSPDSEFSLYWEKSINFLLQCTVFRGNPKFLFVFLSDLGLSR